MLGDISSGENNTHSNISLISGTVCIYIYIYIYNRRTQKDLHSVSEEEWGVRADVKVGYQKSETK